MKTFLLICASTISFVSAIDSKWGTLIHCEYQEAKNQSRECKWIGLDGSSVSSEALLQEFLSHDEHQQHITTDSQINLMQSMQAIEELVTDAMRIRNSSLSYDIGISTRHLSHSSHPAISLASVIQTTTKQPTVSRKLLQSASAEYLNWCDASSNPKGRNVCAPVKSQKQCGSCWAFAAADAIETSVSVSEDTDPIALSPQQFLDCSNASMAHTFTYCWVNNGENSRLVQASAPWIQEKIKWESTNDGCNGGMTHSAFQYAVLSPGIVPELELPYTEVSNLFSIEDSSHRHQCNLANMSTSAHISGWKQVVGNDCSGSDSVNDQLKQALQEQPISVAVSSIGAFQSYKSGIYKCPNDGDFSSHSMVDHAMLLVGYGTDDTDGDYWILKNSYGTSWGEEGFMRIQADEKLNCGINIYPIVPTGATTDASSLTALDGGGENMFLGESFDFWITIAIVLSAVALIVGAIGIARVHRQRHLEKVSFDEQIYRLDALPSPLLNQ